MLTSTRSGDYVRVRSSGRRGRVYETYRGCPYPESWLLSQTRWENPMRFVNSVWVSVAEHGRSRVAYVPLDDLEPVEKFALNHPYDRYIEDSTRW